MLLRQRHRLSKPKAGCYAFFFLVFDWTEQTSCSYGKQSLFVPNYLLHSKSVQHRNHTTVFPTQSTVPKCQRRDQLFRWRFKMNERSKKSASLLINKTILEICNISQSTIYVFPNLVCSRICMVHWDGQPSQMQESRYLVSLPPFHPHHL